LDRDINVKNAEATGLLHACEGNLNKISKLGLEIQENKSEKKIRKNIEKALASKIQDATLMLRKQQKSLLDKLQAFDGGTPLDIPDTSNGGNNNDPDDNAEVEFMDELALGRDEDINKLVDSVNELSALFKQMNALVIEQGTIIDRIDYNLEVAETHITKGKGQLRKAKQSMDSKCANGCIKMLVIGNVIFSFLLFLKFANHSSSSE